jgi:YVTN family beta-propeller protein
VAISADRSTAYVLNPDTNMGPGSISIVDLPTGSVTGTVAMTAPPSALAAAPDGGSAVVTTQYGTALVLDRASATAGAPIAVDAAAHHVMYSHSSAKAYVLSGGMFAATGSVSTIDTASNRVTTTVGVGNGPTDFVLSPDQTTIYVTNGDDSTVSAIDLSATGWLPSITRMWGKDRYETALTASQARFTGPAQSMDLYIVSGTTFPDALSAAALAGLFATPLLLTPPAGLTSEIVTEIQRLQPMHITVVGGTGAVSDEVYNQLVDLAPPNGVSRVAGLDRYATSLALDLTQYGTGSNPRSVYLASGRTFPDALSAAPAAATNRSPVVLIDGAASSLDQATLAYLAGLNTTDYIIVGGTGAVSAGIEKQLAGIGTVTRLAGRDRYATSEAVNHATFATPTRAYFATGSGFADALAGAPLAGSRLSPLYIVPATCVPASTRNDLVAAGAGSITLFGGTGVLAHTIENVRAC